MAPAYLGRSQWGLKVAILPAPPPAPFLRAGFLPPPPHSVSGAPPSFQPPGVAAENPEAGPACVRAGGGGARPARQALSAASSSQLKCESSGGPGGRGAERPPGSGPGASAGGDLLAQSLTRGAGAARHSPAARLPRASCSPPPGRGLRRPPGRRAPEAGTRPAGDRGCEGLRGGTESWHRRVCVCVSVCQCVCVSGCARARTPRGGPAGGETAAGKGRPGPVPRAVAWEPRGGSKPGGPDSAGDPGQRAGPTAVPRRLPADRGKAGHSCRRRSPAAPAPPPDPLRPALEPRRLQAEGSTGDSAAVALAGKEMGAPRVRDLAPCAPSPPCLAFGD
ncbi:uncharacterized protein RBU33_012253 [Hipposideros larvatus]